MLLQIERIMGGVDQCVFAYDCRSYEHWERVLGLKIPHEGKSFIKMD